jgi:hypothetical protein
MCPATIATACRLKRTSRKNWRKKAKTKTICRSRRFAKSAANTPQSDGRADARFFAPRNFGRMGKSVFNDVERLRIGNGAAFRQISRARLRLQRLAPGLLVHSRPDGACRSGSRIQNTLRLGLRQISAFNRSGGIDENLAGKKVSLVIWTTTPWTLPANLGIAVHPDFEYAAVEIGGEVLIVASELVGFVAVKCCLGGRTKTANASFAAVLAKFQRLEARRNEARNIRGSTANRW